MKYLFFLLLFSSLSQAETIVHTVKWEKGVNKKVVKEWSLSLDKISTKSSTTYIKKKVGGKDSLHIKGHRDVIIWIPSSTNLSKQITVVVWFHGHWGFVPKRTFEDRTLKQFNPKTSEKNFVLVIPEMPWTVHGKTPTKRNSLVWKKQGDFLRFINQVEKTIIKHLNKKNVNAKTTKEKFRKFDYRIVGHSAGGSTIKRLGINGDLCRINPSMVVWSDSSYGPWLRLAWNGCLKKRRDIKIKVFVSKGDSPWKRALQFINTFKVVPENLKLFIMKKPKWKHKTIGDNIVKLSGVL